MNKSKIVWICSFGNDEIKKIVGGKDNVFVSPWISELIKLFREKEDIELVIISPNYYGNKNESFKLGKIQVKLYKYRSSMLPAKAYNFTFNYRIATNSVLKIVKDLKPDIIHLHGSENPLYSASVIPLMSKYPVLVTLQGFVSLSSVPKNFISRYIRWNRIRFERIINTKANYFTSANEEGIKRLNEFTTTAKVYGDHYPTTTPNVSSIDCPNKEFDIVYYAKISKDKGVEDLLEALKILKKSRPKIKAIIIGGGNKVYVSYIKSLIEKLNLSNNIEFAGHQPTQQDVFKLAIKAKVYVLPTHFDGLPGSLREAMFMKIPVIANAVGGIPELNDKKECVTLVENKNVSELVEKIKLVLDDTERTNRLVENAYTLITGKYDNKKIYSNILNIYQDILKENLNKNNEKTN
ncbi:Glycosyltransferase involved in cell wall bisynthesis [Tenacibaculum sp. MAR_2010_89]|uniref:glycosyltransferase n=1 Tax=Tenacibaculum sp. MAR_2010_89 TaxID=1250198 RepID=UPI0008943A6B|nr:glycosyltransferase [Tenacibaculum sp. MAR_2010_89]SED67950.1 Glycosyltransferase involved in cell wall bisynthesis [Tenacibaculum sp. MAR_2010_89]